MPNFEGLNSPYNEYKQEKLAIYMDGGEVYKFAVNAMGRNIEEVCERANLTPAQIDWYLPHQANVRIIDASLKKYKIDKSKVLLNIADCGNMSATSVMVLLGRIRQKGNLPQGRQASLRRVRRRTHERRRHRGMEKRLITIIKNFIYKEY